MKFDDDTQAPQFSQKDLENIGALMTHNGGLGVFITVDDINLALRDLFRPDKKGLRRNIPYWASMGFQKSADSFWESHEGCWACGCDHGCNQWLVENAPKAALMRRVMKKHPGNTAMLDKIAQMSLPRVNHILFWLCQQDSRRFNNELWAEEAKQRKEKSDGT
jgi:hypothetical protein